MPVGLQYIRRRIKSIKNTKQVTKAMEAIAATKMRKATTKALASQDYALHAQELIQNLSTQDFASEHPLMKKQEGSKILMLVITSNRGLCGGLNTKIIQAIFQYIEVVGQDNVDIICLGRKGQEALRRRGKTSLAVFDIRENPTSLESRPIAHFLMNEYSAKKYAKVVAAFTDFQSLMRQKPTIKQLLPLAYEIEEIVGPKNHSNATTVTLQKLHNREYIVEPNVKKLLETVMPRYIETQVYQAILEALASEHVARMFAMRNATENATEIIYELTLTYNQARQAFITQEIAEISAGKAALSQ